MKIFTLKYTPLLSAPTVRTVSLNMDKVVAIDGPFTHWRSSNSGYVYYSTLYIYTDVPDLKFTIIVDDPEPLPLAAFDATRGEMPKCELYLRDILSELMAWW